MTDSAGLPAERETRIASASALDMFARRASAFLSRRRTLQCLTVGATAVISSGLGDILAKDKGKKKKRRKRRRQRKQRNRNPPSPPTCAEQCAAQFEVCFERAVDSTLCGDTFSTSCKPCFSDQDCVESGEPYCLTLDGLVERETNEPLTILRSLCGPFFDAVCAQILN